MRKLKSEEDEDKGVVGPHYWSDGVSEKWQEECLL